jgi:hypothetical protein
VRDSALGSPSHGVLRARPDGAAAGVDQNKNARKAADHEIRAAVSIEVADAPRNALNWPLTWTSLLLERGLCRCSAARQTEEHSDAGLDVGLGVFE